MKYEKDCLQNFQSAKEAYQQIKDYFNFCNYNIFMQSMGHFTPVKAYFEWGGSVDKSISPT